ncbi:MAG: TonB family protein [Deltaproteobacteria bacterium]|nr:TonB family protein [Deltaproteobacteria bacterium]
MNNPVEQILFRRKRLHRQRKTRATTIAAVLLHSAAIAVAFILPLLGEAKPAPPRFVTAQVVPLQALGVKEPPPKKQPVKRPPPKEPEQKAPPVPEKITEAPKPKPDATLPTLPSPEKAKPPEPEPVAPEPVSQQPPEPVIPQRQGGETGNRRGTDAFGAAAATLDNPDFTYDYYVKRMVALIRARWSRPLVPEDTESVVHFRILKDGTIQDLELRDPSGSAVFDRAALRAIQDASPLPPLPVGYRQDSLGVSLIVR